MSLFSTLQTSISGMAAQSNALSTVGDNIANSSTTGYKRASAEFETVLGDNVTADYQSGGVKTDVRYGVADQGTLTSTTSPTDLAINGSGFFVVSKDGQGSFLTRAGSFVPDSSGNLVNSAGFELMGYQVSTSGTSSTLSPVNVSANTLQAAASTSGTLTANLPSAATAVTGDTPSSNAADATYTDKTSVTVYDNLGTADVVDVYMTKTADNTWQATAYQQSAAAAGGGFPYSSGPIGNATLNFDPTTGKLTTASANSLSVSVPNGNAVNLDLSGTTQLATDFGVSTATANGNAPSKVDHIKIDTSGNLTAVYTSGAQVQTYKIPLAMVESPDNLTSLNGNVYETNTSSGSAVLSTAATNGVGLIESDSLEESTVDLATELTNMIVAQRGYEANSKVLQASSDLLSVLNRLTTN